MFLKISDQIEYISIFRISTMMHLPESWSSCCGKISDYCMLNKYQIAKKYQKKKNNNNIIKKAQTLIAQIII